MGDLTESLNHLFHPESSWLCLYTQVYPVPSAQETSARTGEYWNLLPSLLLSLIHAGTAPGPHVARFRFHFNKVSNNRASQWRRKLLPQGPSREARCARPRRCHELTRELHKQSDHAALVSAVPLSRGTRLGTTRARSPLSAPALIKLFVLRARLVGKLILSNYTDVTAAFQRVIKIWPACFCFHSLMGKKKHKLN